MKKLFALALLVVSISACYKCPGDSGYSPQCGPSAPKTPKVPK